MHQCTHSFHMWGAVLKARYSEVFVAIYLVKTCEFQLYLNGSPAC